MQRKGMRTISVIIVMAVALITAALLILLGTGKTDAFTDFFTQQTNESEQRGQDLLNESANFTAATPLRADVEPVSTVAETRCRAAEEHI